MTDKHRVYSTETLQKATVPRRRDESAALRSLEIGQMRILARKYPREFRKVAEEIVDALVKI